METLPPPFVSICVPTCNSARFLREALDSILAQTWSNREVIVADNASQDGTVAILREYEAACGIRLILNERNIGAGANFNLLIEQSQGKFIAIYHSDDVYSPTIVEESVAAFSANPHVGLVSTMASVIDAAGNDLYDYELPDELFSLNRDVYDFHDAVMGSLTGGRNRILFVTPSVMVRADIYRECGFFDQSAYSSCCDTEMWLRIARSYNVAVIGRKLMKYRIHQNQGSELEVRRHIGVPDIYKVIAEYSNFLNSDALKEKCAAFLAWVIFKTALKQNCKGLFEESSETLRKMPGGRYRFLRHALAVANKVRLNIHIWP